MTVDRTVDRLQVTVDRLQVTVDRLQVTVDRLLQMQNAWKEPVIQEKFLTVSHNLPDSTLL